MAAIDQTNPDKNSTRFLGAIFLLQAIGSAVSGLFLLDSLLVPGDIAASMTNIANNSVQMRAGILGQMITAIGIVFLGCLLFITLKNQNWKVALVAMALYIFEASILAASRMPAFSLLLVSQASVLAGHPAELQALGTLLYETADFGDWLHILPFALGATMFYYLFYKSGYIPKALALFGLAAASLALIGIPFLLMGVAIPMVIFLPNLLFELSIGVWLLVKGIDDGSETA